LWGILGVCGGGAIVKLAPSCVVLVDHRVCRRGNCCCYCNCYGGG
jgi:hypothetical protein